MADQTKIIVRDFGTQSQPADAGRRIHVVGPSQSGSFTGGITTPLTSRNKADFRTEHGVCALSEESAILAALTGNAVTAWGFDAQTTYPTANYFHTRVNGANAAVQLTCSVSAPVNDDMAVAVRFLTAGTFGTTGITYIITVDGGQTWSSEQALGTALTIPLLPYAQSLVFTTGEVVLAGTVQAAVLYARIGGTNALSAISAVLAAALPGDAIYLASDESNVTKASAATMVLAAEANNRNLVLITKCRDISRVGAESWTTWATAAAAQCPVGSNRKLVPVPGHAPVAGAYVDSPAQRRSGAMLAALRCLTNEVHVDLNRVSQGNNSIRLPLPVLPVPTGANAIMKAPGAPYDPEYIHDDIAHPFFDNLGISCFKGSGDVDDAGLYFRRVSPMSPPGSDFRYIQMCRIVDKAKTAAYKYMVRYEDDEIDVDATTGFIDPVFASSFDAAMNSYLGEAMKGNLISITSTVSRNDDILSTDEFTGTFDLILKGYAKKISFTIGIVNPAINVLA